YDRRADYRDDYRYRCRKSGGTTGLLLGGVAGALLGRAVDTRGDRAPGTIIGAGAGALAGRAIDRNSRC
nr:glycine zipper 2TM domain-containing protein [Sphingobium sp.]